MNIQQVGLVILLKLGNTAIVSASKVFADFRFNTQLPR